MTGDMEFWAIVISSVAAVVPWAFSLHAKVAVIANSVEALPEIVEEIREALQEHENRLNDHAQAIETLKKAAGASG